jgi:type VI secretion system protein ImpJ
MAAPIHVHWQEGLFMLPQHMQLLQRNLIEGLGAERSLATAYPYGLIESRLSIDALDDGKVRFERLRAIMPDGTEVDVPSNAHLAVLDLKERLNKASKPLTVFLAVPNYDPKRANTVEPSASEALIKKRYVVGEITRHDENTGDNASTIQVRKLNARLVLDGDDVTDMQLLPVLRVKPSQGDDLGKPRPDPNFVPTCVGINGSPELRKLLRNLSDAVEAARSEEVNRLGKTGWGVEALRGPQLISLFRLMALNTAAGRLPNLLRVAGAEQAGIHTFSMYLELRDLLSQLSATVPDRDPFEAPAYDHDEPGPVFHALEQKVRSLLRQDSKSKVKKVLFKLDGGVLINGDAVTEDDLTKATAILIGIKTKMDPRGLRSLVEDAEKFKFMPFSKRGMKLFGVRLEEERYAPQELPAPTGMNYFRLLPSESPRMWETIVSEKRLAVVWSDTEKFDYEEVALYFVFS